MLHLTKAIDKVNIEFADSHRFLVSESAQLFLTHFRRLYKNSTICYIKESDMPVDYFHFNYLYLNLHSAIMILSC